MPADTAHTLAALDEMTPAERRRRKVRDAIVDAAEAIFAEDGESGISMRRIAERIDYSPAALYKYFDSKEALFAEIREQFFERLLLRMKAVVEAGEDGPLLSPACLRAYVETGLEQPCHYRLTFAGGFTEETKEEGTFAYAAAEHLEAMIEGSIAEGWFKPAPTELAAASVWSSAHGLTMLAVTVPQFPDLDHFSGPTALDDVIEFHAELMLRGFASDRLHAWLDRREGAKLSG
ncbi:MAG: TetR/AcrR family transcriptional regulator [Pseudomonadota bacterium]